MATSKKATQETEICQMGTHPTAMHGGLDPIADLENIEH
jgi:hypothetical protein